MRMAINDRLYGLVADCTNGLEQNLAVVFAITGVKSDEPFVGINHANGSKPKATKGPDTLCRL